VKEQSLTKQLRLQEKISNDNGFKPELIINEGAKISKPLQNSTFDIKTYQSTTITLQPDATKWTFFPSENGQTTPSSGYVNENTTIHTYYNWPLDNPNEKN